MFGVHFENNLQFSKPVKIETSLSLSLYIYIYIVYTHTRYVQSLKIRIWSVSVLKIVYKFQTRTKCFVTIHTMMSNYIHIKLYQLKLNDIDCRHIKFSANFSIGVLIILSKKKEDSLTFFSFFSFVVKILGPNNRTIKQKPWKHGPCVAKLHGRLMFPSFIIFNKNTFNHANN